VLGGKDSLAWKVLKSVTDEDEMRQLELYSRERKGQMDELVMAEIQSLVVRVQALARQLPNNGDSLIRQVLALPSSDSVEEEDDEGGTGEQEESKTERKKRRHVRATRRRVRKRRHRFRKRESDRVRRKAKREARKEGAKNLCGHDWKGKRGNGCRECRG
jgi:hypothetical protein